MLFGYPVTATQNNWVHDCLCEAVRKLHAAVDAGKKCPRWPDVFPSEYRSTLKPRTGLRDRVKDYNIAIRNVSKADRDVVLDAVEKQNRISDLLSGAANCPVIDDLPAIVREPVRELFGFGFGLLTDLKIRDEHYEAIYAAAPEHVCPFCGTEDFEAPGMAREALDHYLTKSRYPFAAANLRNLVPMGHKCNSNYKLASDILYGANGARRVAVDPYNHTKVGVVLDESNPFNGRTANTPQWQIGFEPDSPSVTTWDQVFSVRERYCQNHLDPAYANWLWLFGGWMRSSGMHADTDEALVEALQRYEEYWVASGVQDRAFLKAAVFRMLRRHCENGHQRLKDQLRSLTTPLKIVAEEVA